MGKHEERVRRVTPGNEKSTRRAAIPSELDRLQGWRCRACGTTSFPIAEGCIVCGSLAGDAVDLAWSGTL
ncbi:MAG: zinc ribbon domain-containing protein, partial [Planctomycetota bacterium]